MPADRFRRGGFLAMLALLHLSTASEPYPTQWRVRSSGLVRWDLAEFRLYSDAACRTEIPVLDNIASGRVHGDENPIARQHYFNDKVFDRYPEPNRPLGHPLNRAETFEARIARLTLRRSFRKLRAVQA